MLSCLWCTSSRKSSTPPGSLGTPWSGQVLKWYCQTVLSVFPWEEDANTWKHNPSDQNPAESIHVAKLRQIRRWLIQPAAQCPWHHSSRRRAQAQQVNPPSCLLSSLSPMQLFPTAFPSSLLEATAKFCLRATNSEGPSSITFTLSGSSLTHLVPLSSIPQTHQSNTSCLFPSCTSFFVPWFKLLLNKEGLFPQ